jgi:type I restriction enzyme, S subunit
MSSPSKRTWPRFALSDLVDHRGITYGVVQPGQHYRGGTPILRVNNITPAGLSLNDPMRIDPDIAGRHARSRLTGGEVLITLVGSVGQVAVAPCELAGWNVARAVGVIPVREEIPARWVAWCLQTPEARAYLDARLNTTVQTTLNLRDLAALQIPVPPDRVMASIASVLGVLDDKIDSNGRLARLLEDAAGVVFRARFVDFVGVAELEDGETGLVPNGWRKGRLGDLVTQRKERCRPSEETAALPYVPIDVIPARSLMLSGHRSGEEAQSSLTAFGAGDVLFGAMRPYFHKVAIAPFAGTTRTTVFVLRPLRVEDWAYTALLLGQATTVEFATRTSRGSTIPYAAWEGVLSDMPVVVPPPDERAKFGEFAQPLLAQIQNFGFEQRTLTEIRDLLLPRLISGAIRVSDAADPNEVIGPLAEAVAGPLS